MKHFGKTGKLVFVLLLCAILPNVAQAVIPTTERDALIALYDATAGNNWKNKQSWKTNGVFSDSGTECDWFGVICDVGQSKVIRLELTFNQLSGDLPTELGNLRNLIFISLYGNQLTSIPAALGQLSQLETLVMGANLLITLPAELGNLGSLKVLWLSENQLTSIPAELGKLPQLQMLILEDNQLSSVPAALGNIGSLLSLWLGKNRLNTVPAALGNLVNLQSLSLVSNGLTGVVPDNFANLTALTSKNGLNLSYNAFHINNAGLRDFLNKKQFDGDLMATQTLDAVNVTYSNISEYAVTLRWDAVANIEPGGY